MRYLINPETTKQFADTPVKTAARTGYDPAAIAALDPGEYWSEVHKLGENEADILCLPF